MTATLNTAHPRQDVSEPIRVTALGDAAGGAVHLLAKHGDTEARCGFSEWHSYIKAIDWFEEPNCPICMASLARDLSIDIPEDVWAELTELAAPWPPEWMLPPREGDRKRVVGLCAGPGGWDESLGAIDAEYDVVGVDASVDACQTAEAAGHRRIVADITTLDPEHRALRWTTGLKVSPPCPPFSTAGKHAGLLADNLKIFADALVTCAEAAGNIWVDDAGDGREGFAKRSGATWADVRRSLDGLTDPRIGLMLEVMIWPFGLMLQGAPLAWMAMEQSANLPEEIREDFEGELACAGWEMIQWAELDAADYGVASRRKRVFMMASRYGRIPGSVLPYRSIGERTLAAALGWGPGERINTRGVRGLDASGRPKGGNCFSADHVSWCLTGKTRTWFRESDGYRFTTSEGGQLVGFNAGYPWQGSRTSAFQQIGDVVCPPVGAAVLGALTGRSWELPVKEYLEKVYGVAVASVPSQRDGSASTVEPSCLQ